MGDSVRENTWSECVRPYMIVFEWAFARCKNVSLRGVLGNVKMVEYVVIIPVLLTNVCTM